jgi:hypothetical protein
MSTLSRKHLLTTGDVLRFDRPRGLCVRSVAGSLWITVDGQRDDIQLDAGQSRRFDGRGTVLVSALGGDAVLALSASAQPMPAWAARLIAAWTALRRRAAGAPAATAGRAAA